MRWLLPDGIDEMLPTQALTLETNRRMILDLFAAKNYQLVIPPLVEFTDSLLTGSGSDLEHTTAKFTDPMSGKMMGISADITPQTARIDAHSMNAKGINRLCYAATLFRMFTDYPNQNRTPMQIGVECYGDATLEADIEIASIMLETLSALDISNITLDLGHCGLLSAILEEAELNENQHSQLITILQQKSAADLIPWLETVKLSTLCQKQLTALMQLYGDSSLLDSTKLKEFIALTNNTKITACIDQLKRLSNQLLTAFPNLTLFYDLGEVRGFHYHTGIIFAVYHPNCGYMIANGGRYDNIGSAFGNARPATGFSADLKLLSQLGMENSASPTATPPLNNLNNPAPNV